MENALTDADLDAIKRREEIGVPGVILSGCGPLVDFIAQTRQDVKALLAEVRRLQELIEDIRLEDHASHCEWD